MAKFHHVGNIFKVYLFLGKVFNSLWHNLYAIAHNFIAENGQILKTQFGHLVTLFVIDFTYGSFSNRRDLND